jgi:multiple sugar transport system ATP-binding protein
MNDGRIQQVGTPTDIYDNPANAFVASFIGSPAMNLVEGSLNKGVFEAPGVRVPGFEARHEGRVILGFRAEDVSLADGNGNGNGNAGAGAGAGAGADNNGQLYAPVYSLELLGDASMISYRIGDALVSVKAPKNFRAEIGAKVATHIPAGICHLFDASTGMRW